MSNDKCNRQYINEINGNDMEMREGELSKGPE